MPFLTEKDIAAVLGLKTRTVRAWRTQRRADGPPYVHLGGSVRYPSDEFQRWLSTRQRGGERVRVPKPAPRNKKAA
jgi:predicted DNA-binding transcriptional regulator AlpA